MSSERKVWEAVSNNQNVRILAVAFVCLAIGAIIGGFVVANSKFSHVADISAKTMESVNALQEKYGVELQKVFDVLLQDKVVEALEGMESERISAVLTRGTEELGNEAIETGKQALRTLRSKLKEKEE